MANWKGFGLYEYFVKPKWFLFASSLFEHEEFADLDLRTTLGAGGGHQFFESDEHLWPRATRWLSGSIRPRSTRDNAPWLTTCGHEPPDFTLPQAREPLDKILPVRVIFEYRFTFDPSNDDMIQGAEVIYAGSTKACDLKTVFSTCCQHYNVRALRHSLGSASRGLLGLIAGCSFLRCCDLGLKTAHESRGR